MRGGRRLPGTGPAASDQQTDHPFCSQPGAQPVDNRNAPVEHSVDNRPNNVDTRLPSVDRQGPSVETQNHQM
jgi:hypothetical protein